MDDNAVLLIAITGIWGVPLCWLGVLGIRETVDWWHRRHQHGTHHPCVPTARMVWEIHQRLEREAARRVPRRSIAVHPIAVRPPGPDGAYRAVAHLGGLRIAQVEELGQDEPIPGG
ncbi:MAG: hypothetical protein ACRDRV_18605 [Pseudonocardiaceae bacterium]